MTLGRRAVHWTSGESPRGVRYAWAILVALAAVGLTAALSPWVHVPGYMVCVGAVAVSAAFGGAGPGLLTAGLAGALTTLALPRLGGVGEVVLASGYAVVAAVVAHAAGWSRGAFSAALGRRRETARAIRGRLEFLRAITRAMDEGVYTLDGEGRITYLNAAAERMLGFRQAELLGMTLKQALRCKRGDGTCSGRDCRLLAVCATGQSVRGSDDLLTRKDGTCFPVRYSSAPLVRGGANVGAVVAFQDITDERRHEARERFLAQATEELASSIDYAETLGRVARLALPFLGDWSMVVVLDDAGAPRCVAVEALSPEHAGISREMLQGYPIDLEADHGVGRVLRTGQPELLPEVADLAGHGGKTVSERAEMLRRLGVRSFMAVPLRARGRLLGVLDFGICNSERRFGPADLAVATELGGRCALAIDNALLHRAARDAVRAREDVLALVSHDLRNPLSAIRMAASVVERVSTGEARPERALPAATTIRRAGERMVRLVDDLLDLGSIDAGRFSLKRTALSARRLVAEALEAVAAAAHEAEVAVVSEPPREAVSVLGDRDRLLQVLVNLLTNAVKVTPPGGRVSVRCRHVGDAVVFSVCDTGPGISREQQAHVFDAYWRGANVQYKGTGLGLSIAKRILEAHDSRLRVVSRPGRGAAFRFTLRAIAHERAVATATPAHGLRAVPALEGASGPAR